MRYRNTKTGVVIDVVSEVKGKYWEPIEVPGASKPKAKAEPKAPAPKKEATKPAPKPATPAPKAAAKKTTTKTKRK